MKDSKQHNKDLLYLTGLKYCNDQYRQGYKHTMVPFRVANLDGCQIYKGVS
jgi:hypothetical protein